jgi:hypothetical protein
MLMKFKNIKYKENLNNSFHWQSVRISNYTSCILLPWLIKTNNYLMLELQNIGLGQLFGYNLFPPLGM